MATAESVKDKIRGLIDTANAATGKSDKDLTSGVNSLVEGYVKIKLQEKTATENGVVLPDSQYDGLSRVTVAIFYPIYSGAYLSL